MKVIHVQKATGVSGSERHLLSLLPRLMAAGHEVRMLVLAAERADLFGGPLHALGVDVASTSAGPDFNPVAVARIVAAIRAWRPDLVHAHLFHADAYAAAASAITRTPLVRSVHAALPAWTRTPIRQVERMVGRVARRTIAISEDVRRFIVAHRLAAPDSVRVIHYGIDAEGWTLGANGRADSRRALGLADAEVALAVASRLVEGKGHSALLNAFAEALRARSELRLLVAGDGPLRATLERSAGPLASAGSVRFLGHVTDVRTLMNACDIFIFPTLPTFGEGFGLAMLEAMASSLPIVATNVGPMPEVVVDDGTGVLVPPGDVAALASAIVRLASDPLLRRRLGEGGRERAQDHFSLRAMTDATVQVYREALG